MVVTLIGYRGCGKSTIASLLAQRLNWSWIDADTELERRAGKSIRDIFRDEGEPHFRRLERDVMHDVLHRDRLVIAAGGGAILDPDTQYDLRQSGPVVWLEASLETLATRIAADTSTAARRPTLTTGSPVAEIQTVLAQREPIYRECATHIVSVDNRSPDEIVSQILENLGTSFGSGART
ncbi:MAG: shikimate kinase [Planctomycetaceae bacterium]